MATVPANYIYSRGFWYAPDGTGPFFIDNFGTALPLSGAPLSISGNTGLGSVLTLNVATGWVNAGGNWTRSGVAISGATGLTYTVTAADRTLLLSYVSTNIPFLPNGLLIPNFVVPITVVPPSVSTTPFFSDSFTDADNTSLASHTAELGGTWTVPMGGWNISANQAQMSGKGSLGAVMLAGIPAPGPDNRFTCDFIGTSGGSSDGIVFRANDANNLFFAGVGANTGGCSKFSGGTETIYSNGNTANTSPRALDIYVVGPAVVSFVNGSLNLVRMLDSFDTSVAFGFRMAGNIGGNKVDNLKGYSVAQGDPFEKPIALSHAPVLLDTDMGSDTDDIIALLMLHGLQTTGEVNIVACTINNGAANSVNAVYAINSYKSRASIPLGVTKAAVVTSTCSQVDSLATGSYGTPGPGLNAPDAVGVMRAALNNAPTNGLVMISIGVLTNYSNLLNSPANYASDGINLTGLQLVQQKCKHLSFMAGQYGHGVANVGITSYEFNASSDTGATDNTFAKWPSNVPLFATGFELGSGFNASCSTALVNVTRSAWDPIATLVGVRGTSWGGKQYYAVNQGRGYSQAARIGYIPDPNGNFFVVREFANPTATGGIAAQITTLCGT